MPEFNYRGCLGVFLAAALGLGGCVPSLEGNQARDPNDTVPEHFRPADPNATSQESKSVASRDWSDFFTDPKLVELIETAIENNQELNIRLQEIIIRRSEVTARRGEYQPRLDAGLGAGVEKVGRRTSQGTSDEAHGLPENLGDFRFGLNASWEIDVWGKLRNATKAAHLRYLSSIEGQRFVTTQVVAEIANSYYALIALDNQIEVLEKNIELQQDGLEVVILQKEAARVTQLAVQRFQAELLKNRSRKFDLLQQRIEAENRINFLVGRYPQKVERNSASFDTPLPSTVHTGVPTQLLDNRPDVRQAKLELEAAKLDVKAAKAGFYPSLSIEAGVGYESFNVKHLVTTPESLAYNLAGNLTAPLLNRTAIKAQYRTANATQIQALYNYERAILQGFTDVANQLAMLDNLNKSYELEAQQVRTLTESIEVSNILFQSARADYMEVLMTRRDSLEAQMELLETKMRQFQALVDVYQALGGGWRKKAQTLARK